MIRPFTVLCLLAACGSGLYLYSEKHRTALLDRDIGRVIHATEAARARTGILRAEWALLNEPGRLQDMAGRYLTLHPMAPTQFVQLAELSTHLPAPVVTPPGGSTDDDDAPGDATATAPAAPAPNAATPLADLPVAAAEPPAAHPALTGKTDGKPAHKVLLASAGSAAGHPHPQHHVTLADREAPSHDGLMTRGTPLPLAAPQPMGASVFSAMAHPMRYASGPAAHPSIVSAVPSYPQARPYVGSALGGGTALPPPVPYGR